MPVMEQDERIAAEKRVREQLGLPMMGTNPTNTVSAETMQMEREILGTLIFGFGEMWGRPGLDIETRCYITLSILTARYQHKPLADYVRGSLKVGIKPTDILETMLHVATYAGLTAAIEAINVAREVFTEDGITQPSEEEITPFYPMDRQARQEAMARVGREINIGRNGNGPYAAPMAYMKTGVWTSRAKDRPIENEFNLNTGEFGYGECWGRPALGYRIRSFITMAALQAYPLNDQLYFHINNALNLGITPEEIHEALGHGAVYCGCANWRNAANVAREVFLQRGVVEPA